MLKNVKLLSSLLALALLVCVLSSCKDDEEPAPAQLSFASAALTVNEDDDLIEIEVVLDKPAAEDFTVEYELDGDAIDAATVGTDDPSDYEINEDENDYGEIEIAQGETSGKIQIQLFSDFDIEDPETIEITITGVNSDKIEITRDDETEITVEQEDGLAIRLGWEESTVDLDLVVRVGETTDTWLGVLTGSLYGRPEIAFIPKVFSDAAFGMSYTYYSGTVEPLDFTVDFIEIIDGDIEPQANWQSFSAQYSLDNINEWDDISTTQVVQTFRKSGNSWTDFTEISVPTTGSRIGTSKVPSTPIKIKDFQRVKSLHH
jgi:hypothetical protein